MRLMYLRVVAEFNKRMSSGYDNSRFRGGIHGWIRHFRLPKYPSITVIPLGFLLVLQWLELAVLLK